MINLFTQRHRGFMTALGTAAVVAIVAFLLGRDFAFEAASSAFFLVYLAVVWATALPKLSPEFLRKHAVEDDPPALFIFAVMLIAVAASVVSLFLVLAKGAHSGAFEAILGVLAVIGAWFAVHTMWALHYAYEYYDAPQGGKGGTRKGLTFPGTDAPDGLSFLYFSFVVGMTAQTSDTEVCSNAMRRIVLIHGVFSFFFNTCILAAAVNAAVAFGR